MAGVALSTRADSSSDIGTLSVVCSSTAETVHEQDFLDHLTGVNAAGVLVINGRYAMPDVGFSPYRELWQQRTPIVLVNSLHQRAPLPAVAVDLAAAAAMGVDHLATLGHDQIGLLIGPRRYSSALAMIDGFERSLAERGFDGDGGLVSETLFTFEGGQAGMATLLEGGVTGIIAGSDLMALGAIAAVRSWGASVPEDVAVIGFDGTPAMAFTDPPLTTLRQPVGRMAAAVATMLVAQMTGTARSKPRSSVPSWSSDRRPPPLRPTSDQAFVRTVGWRPHAVCWRTLGSQIRRDGRGGQRFARYTPGS